MTDSAGFLSDAARTELNARLETLQSRSGHQVLLWIGRTTGAAPIEDFAVHAFAAWRVGRKGLDDGVVLFIMSDDRKIRIEVGYGLEDRLTDARASTIIREQMAPRLQAGDRDGAARAGVGGILAALGDTAGGAPDGEGGQAVARPSLSLAQLVVIGLLALLLLVFAITHPGLAILFLTTLASGRGGGAGGRGGGGFGGGGGFSGGGGRSGGGGASGGW